MLSAEKILVTGPAGQITFPRARELAKHSEVWGIACFSDECSRERVEKAGIAARSVDLGVGDFGGLPAGFTWARVFAVDPLKNAQREYILPALAHDW